MIDLNFTHSLNENLNNNIQLPWKTQQTFSAIEVFGTLLNSAISDDCEGYNCLSFILIETSTRIIT
jgi:hypothetical protein